MKLKDIYPFVRNSTVVFLGQNLKTYIFNKLKTSDCRMFYIFEGRGTVSIYNKVYELQPGCVILFQSGTEYLWQISGNDVLKLIAINFDYTQNNTAVKNSFAPVHSNRFLPDNILETVNFSDVKILNQPIFLNNADYLESRFRLLTTEKYFGEFYCSELLSSVLKSIIISIVRDIAIRNDTVSNKEALLVRETVQYIQSNYNTEINNDDIANELHFNKIYLNRIFKKHIGTSMHAFLTIYRMNMAKDLLRSSNMSIGEIAVMSGIFDLSHFSKAFIKCVGLTPTEYRKSLKIRFKEKDE